MTIADYLESLTTAIVRACRNLGLEKTADDVLDAHNEWGTEMRVGEFFVSDDSGDVLLVFTDHEGDSRSWAITTEKAMDLAARLIVKVSDLEDA